MSQDAKISPIGLFTDPSALEAPPGGLLAAEEVVNRRAGTLEPRPGLLRSTGAAVYKALDFSSDYLKVGTSTTVWSDGTTRVYDESAATDLLWNLYSIFGVESRKNLYLSTRDALRKVTTPTSAVKAYRCGAPRATVAKVSESSGGTAVETGMYVAYRVVTKAKDANGVEVRSGVSGRAVAGHSHGNTYDFGLRIRLHKGDPYGWVVGIHSIEIYRTLNETTEIPTDELYLAKTIEITAGHITAGYIDVTDSTTDDDLGQSLYTNSSQEGIEGDHLTPPAAKCVDLFNGSLYLGDLTYAAKQIFQVQSRRTLNGASTEIGGHLISSGTFTSGSTDVTVADSSAYLVGMIIGNSENADYTVNTEYVRISSIVNATTIRLTGTWNRTTGSYNRFVYDSIRIGSQYFVSDTVRYMVESIRGSAEGATSTNTASPTCTAIMISDDTSALRDDVLSNRAFLLECHTPGVTPPQIWATHGDLYNPVLPEPTVATGFTLPQEVLPNGIAWSNELEPEHFTGANVDEAGSGRGRVMALASLSDAILVFKSDGLFGLSGYASSGISFRSIDKDVRPLYPHGVSVLGDRAFAWCDLGVMECSPDGAANISSQAIGNLLGPMEKEIKANSTTAYGVWSAPNRKDEEFLLGVPATGALGVAERVYVYSKAQASWVNWMIAGSTTAGLYHDATALLSLFSASYAYLETPDSTVDVTYSVTITAITAARVVTITAGSGWTPVVGDTLVRSGVTALVTAVTSATVFTVSDTVTTGAATAGVAFTSVITPIGASVQAPNVLKCWGESAVLWESTKGVMRYGVSVTSSVSSTAVAQTRTLAEATRPTTEKAEAYRFVVPRNHGRSTRIYPSISIRQGLSAWRYAGLMLGYRPMTERTRTR